MAAPIRLLSRCDVWKNVIARGGKGLLALCPAACRTHRTILSDAYRAEDVWQNRKRLEVHMDDLRVKLDHELVTLKQPVASVELQMFIDNIINEDELHASQQHLYSFRHTPLAHHLRPYTVHSWLRVCLDFHQPLRALESLQNKTHYGLFPDMYTFNLLLDHFIQEKDISSAFKVAKELMLIEVLDEKTPLAQALCLYVCHQLLVDVTPIPHSEVWSLGMTLADATRNSPSCLARSYHVIGCCMTGNPGPLTRVMGQWLSGEDNAKIINAEAVDYLKAALDEDLDDDTKTRLQEHLTSLASSGRIDPTLLDDLVHRDLLPSIPKFEESDIKQYPLILQEWHNNCVEAIKKQGEDKQAMERAAKEARLEKLLQEVGGVDYWIQKAKKEGKEVKDWLLEEEIKRQ